MHLQPFSGRAPRHHVSSSEGPNEVKRLEVNIAELQSQGSKLQQWFQEAGQRMSNTENQLGQLRQVVEQQGQAVTAQIAEIQQEVGNKTQKSCKVLCRAQSPP